MLYRGINDFVTVSRKMPLHREMLGVDLMSRSRSWRIRSSGLVSTFGQPSCCDALPLASCFDNVMDTCGLIPSMVSDPSDKTLINDRC
jgi:hypothetical protein